MNQTFGFRQTAIEGLIEITPFNADDIRGCFTKDYSKEVFLNNGIPFDLAEIFYTTNKKGVMRALHFQLEHQQDKLVRCIMGRIYDVVVDLRPRSPSFLKWLGFYMDDHHHKEIFIPGGCAHGYLVLEPSVVCYKCGEKFYGEYDSVIRWNDPEIGVAWPLDEIGGIENLILSDKDRDAMSLSAFLEKHGGLR